MAVQANYSIARETQDLVRDMRDGTDPVEKELPRLAFRVLGIFSVGPFFADAYVDYMKCAALQSRLFRLESTVASNPTETFELAVQKQIYTNIKNYTDNAQNIKLGTGICGLIGTVMTVHGMLTNNQFSEMVGSAFGLASWAGLGMAVINRYTAGSQLRATNKELAESTVKI